MEDLREKQIEEAVKRMRKLKMLETPIEEFLAGKLNKSEGAGILFWLDDDEKDIVKKFEEEHGGIVYHVIKSVMRGFGTMYSLMYVSQYLEEWEIDNDDLKEGSALAYVVNVSAPECSEFGTIGVRPVNGGLTRIL